MKTLLRQRALVAAGIAAAMAVTSCAYDPYYTSVGGSYSTGYGDGYGYGGSNFNTSVFVSTGNPRWGYDPYCYSYYDYHRRCYYDPYLNGYYPVGYRPAVIVGAPHPYGWRPGRGYCPPPSYVRNITVVNYRNREAAYRSTNYDWARQVRQQPVGRVEDRHPSRNTQGRPNQDSRPTRGMSTPRIEENRKSTQQGARETRSGRLPAGYNTPVTRSATPPQAHSTRQTTTGARNLKNDSQTRQTVQPTRQGRLPQAQPPRQQAQPSRQQAQPPRQQAQPSRQQVPPSKQGGNPGRSEEARPQNRSSQRGVRGLGQG